MGMIPLAQAPPTLLMLFPKEVRLEDKAFKFLECFYENGTQRRTGRILKISPKTVKSINEFLLNTEVGQRFNALLMEQTEDFYSAKTLTSLFEGWNKEIDRVEDSIKIEGRTITVAEKLLLETPTSTLLKVISAAQTRKLRYISEKRMWMTKLLDASLACRPLGKAANREKQIDDAKEVSTNLDELLEDFNPASTGADPN